MRFEIPKFLRKEIHSYRIEDGKCIVIRHKKPQIAILYDPQFGSATIINKEPNIPERKLQEFFMKALAYARANIKEQPR